MEDTLVSKNLIKIHAGSQWMPEDGPGGENLWGVNVGYQRAVVYNTPMWTDGLSLNDLVRIDSQGEIETIIESGGMSNLRVLLTDDPEHTLFHSIADQVKAIGGSAEGGADGALLALSVTKGFTKFVTDLLDSHGLAWENGN